MITRGWLPARARDTRGAGACASWLFDAARATASPSGGIANVTRMDARGQDGVRPAPEEEIGGDPVGVRRSWVCRPSPRTSEGPAMMSMPTVPNTRRLAAATYAFAGPDNLRHRRKCRCAIGQSRNRLRAADAVSFRRRRRVSPPPAPADSARRRAHRHDHDEARPAPATLAGAAFISTAGLGWASPCRRDVEPDRLNGRSSASRAPRPAHR